MPKLEDPIPENLKVYTFHKVDMTWKGTDNAIGTCPFCLGERKFFVGQDKGLYQCKRCGGGLDGKSGGNHLTFLRRLHQESSATEEELQEVVNESGKGLKISTLQRWGMVRSYIDGEWLFPAYGNGGETKIHNIYRWTPMKQKDDTYKRRMLSTPKPISHALFGYQFFDPKKPKILLAEGWADPMIVEQAIMKVKKYPEYNILGVPGCEVFKDEWLKHFKGKEVGLLFDNDHPRTVKGKRMSPAGYKGMLSVYKKLKGIASQILILSWGAEDHNPALKDGFDMCDLDLLTEPIAV